MLVCQNPNCPNPFNPDGNRFCFSCGQSNFGSLLRNRYRIKELLGEGGFGRTYAGVDADRLNTPCVIKQFFPSVQSIAARTKAAELFKSEAKRLYELGENHSQIPRLISYFEQGSCLYLVQEFIPGQNLLEELEQQAFNETQIRELLADILPVLQFIHERNVIHRDIKPENIIRRQSDGKLVLIDFGSAKQVTQASIGRPGTGIYTIGYAPLEQTQGIASPASDLYGLGATCVRLLTDCFPLQDAFGNVHDRVYDASKGQWLWQEYLLKKGITLSENLGQILDKLLKHFSRERYQLATEVIQDLNYPQSLTSLQPKVRRQLPILQTFEFDVVTVDAYGIENNRNIGTARLYTQNLGGVTLEMVLIPGGTFMMGSSDHLYDSESPQHQVSIDPFFIGKFAVTQAQWKAVAALPQVNRRIGSDPSGFKGANRPVDSVSWEECVEFCARLSQKTGYNYRLPSEAQWEYACRARTTTPFHFGKTITSYLANYDGMFMYADEPKGTHLGETVPVGSFEVANAFGLYDMHGNVWEWCADPWHENYHGATTDGIWEVDGNDHLRVLRGGSWNSYPKSCRSASRLRYQPYTKNRNFGFRVVALF